jgi:hypothetical protein
VAIKAIFVGINKHLDPATPELSGARRHAMALWALFLDMIDGLLRRRATKSHARNYERGGDTQIILRTCRDCAFRHIEGNRINTSLTSR